MAFSITRREHHSLGSLTGVTARLTFGVIGNRSVDSLLDGDFNSFDNWTEANDFGEGTRAYIFTEGGNGGTLTQASATLANVGVNSQRYIFKYTIASVTDVGSMTATITTAFGNSAVTLDVATAGDKETSFLSDSSASTADFVISVAVGTTGDSFTISAMSLIPVGYPTNGESLVAGDLGLGQILMLNILQGEDGFIYEWNPTSDLILVRQGPTSAGANPEIASLTDLSASAIEIFALGR